MQNLNSAMTELKKIFGNEDLVERLRKMYNPKDGGAGYDLEVLVSEILGYGHGNMSFDEFFRTVNTADLTIIQLINDTYAGHGINASGPMTIERPTKG
jgi:hypothetical protein